MSSYQITEQRVKELISNSEKKILSQIESIFDSNNVSITKEFDSVLLQIENLKKSISKEETNSTVQKTRKDSFSY